MADPQARVDVSASDGTRIVNEAASWKGTPYSLIGARSLKSKGGDCSGSTYLIYSAAGFNYDYQVSGSFASYALKTGIFRELDSGEKRQDGDILSWSDHMAIYTDFANDLTNAITNRKTRDGKHTWKQSNDMWTATHPGGNAYGPGKISFFKPHKEPRVFRYQKMVVVK